MIAGTHVYPFVFFLCFKILDVYKNSIIFPIHKSTGKTDVNNYRPIPPPSSISKGLEKMYQANIDKFLYIQTKCLRIESLNLNRMSVLNTFYII